MEFIETQKNNQTRVAIEECRWSPPIACWYVLQGKFGCQGIAEQCLRKKENCIIEWYGSGGSL